jgi:hypothetical protein
MSFRALEWAMVASRTRRVAEQAVLLVLANFANDEGTGAYPSVATIASRTKLTARSVSRALRGLEGSGDITVERGGGNRTNRYVICMTNSSDRGEHRPPTRRHPRQNVTPDTVSSQGRQNVRGGVTQRQGGGDTVSPDPSIDPSGDPSADPGCASKALLFPISSGGETRQRKARRADAQAFVDLWHAATTPPLPRVVELTAKRQEHIFCRLAERTLDEWRTVMTRIEASRFCRGQNDRGWVASFDWLIGSPDAAVKVLEGKYDERSGKSSTVQPQASTIPDVDATMRYLTQMRSAGA